MALIEVGLAVGRLLATMNVTDPRPRPTDTWVLTAVLLGMLTCGYAFPLCVRCFLPAAIDYNEGWNAFRQASAWRQGALYGHAPGLSVTNYPPLSFHMVGALVSLGADPVLSGRLLSLAAIGAVGLSLTLVARRMVASRALAACSALGWLAGLELWTPERIGSNDPQLLAMAFEAAALLLFVREGAGTRKLVLVAGLTVTGLFTKHNLVAVPLGITLTLVARRSWRSLAIWIAACAAGGAILTILTLAEDGRSFFQHLLDPRLFVPRQAWRLPLLYALVSSPALIAVGAWAWRERAAVRVQPLILAWLASLAEILAFAGGDGVSESIFQDAIMMTALLQPIALDGLSGRNGVATRTRRTGSPAASLLLLLMPAIVAAQTGARWKDVAASAARRGELKQAVALLRDARGTLVCEDLLLCFRAGRPSFFDAYYVSDQRALGRLRSSQLDDLVAGRRLAAIEVGAPDGPDGRAHAGSRLSPSFIALVERNYRPRLRGEGFVIYGPDRERTSGLLDAGSRLGWRAAGRASR